MSVLNRKFIRFSLEIPALKTFGNAESEQTLIKQISLGGCLTEIDETTVIGDEFRMEISLPNKNKLPLQCKAIYKFEGKGIGLRFSEITVFEQHLLADIISEKLAEAGLPLLVDPFLELPTQNAAGISDQISEKLREDFRIEDVIAISENYQ